MFCPKCGAKSIDGGVFCQECGARLIVNESEQSATETVSVKQEYSQVNNGSVDMPKKKKSGKLLFILGIVVLAVAAIVVVTGMWDGKIDYVSTVKEHKPFEETQGLDGTFADVLEKYVSPPDWEERESGDIHYVDISGVIKETDYELVVTIKVSPNSDHADKVKIEPESVVFNNEKSLTKNDAVEFLCNMFSAYNDGYGDLSELLSSTDSQEITLSETYTNDEEGISFMYPSAWVPLSEEELVDYVVESNDTLVLLANATEDLPEENSYIMVSKFDATQNDIDHLFVDDEQFSSTFDNEVTIEDTSTTEIDGVAARKIAYIGKDGNGRQSYFYAVDSVLYRIDFSYRGESAGNKQRFFDAIIDSYKIMSVEKTFMDDTLSPGNEKAGQPVDDTVDELFYMGIPIDTILEMSAEDMIAAFGEPDERDESFLCWYDGAIVNFDSMGFVSSFGGNPEKFELNGQNLNLDYNGLVETFGREPDSQEMFDLLEIQWFYDGYSILIGLDEDGLPGKVEVWKENTMDNEY